MADAGEPTAPTTEVTADAAAGAVADPVANVAPPSALPVPEPVWVDVPPADDSPTDALPADEPQDTAPADDELSAELEEIVTDAIVPVDEPRPPALPPPLPALPPPLPDLPPFAAAVPVAAFAVTEAEAAAIEEERDAAALGDLAAAAAPTRWRVKRRVAASLLHRAGAAVVDVVATVLLMLLVICVVAVLGGFAAVDSVHLPGLAAAMFPLIGLMEAFTGTSPGKAVFAVQSCDPTGRPVPAGAGLARWALRFLLPGVGAVLALAGPSLVSAAGMADVLPASPAVWRLAGGALLAAAAADCGLALLRGDRRAFHDLFAGTAVLSDTPVAFTGDARDDAWAARPPDEPADAPADDLPATDPDDVVTETDGGEWRPAPQSRVGPARRSGPGPDWDPTPVAAAAAAEAEADDSNRPVFPAGFLRRAGAAGIDVAVMAVVWALALPALFAALVWAVDAPPFAVGVAEVLALAVVASFEVVGTAGVGKTVLGLRVAGVDDQGVPATRQLLARAAMKYVPPIAAAGLLAARAADRLNGAAYTGVLPHVGFAAAAAGVLAGPIAVAYVLGWLVTLLPGGRSLHDRATGTAVYEVYDLVRLRARRGSASRAGFDVWVQSVEFVAAPAEFVPAAAVVAAEAEWIEAPPEMAKDESAAGGP